MKFGEKITWHTPFLRASLLGAALLAIALLAVSRICAFERDDDAVRIHTAETTPGYVLVAPYRAEDNYAGGGEVLLLDTGGHAAHAWKTKHPVLAAVLTPSGTLFTAQTPPIAAGMYPSQGTTGILQELDWDGNVIWEYQDSAMTHDFDLLPDGSVAYTRWNIESPAFAASVVGGMHTSTSTVWTNELVVVDRNKEIVWTWRVADHVDAWRYPMSSLVPRADWAHINSVRYVAANPLSGTPAFLVSFRDISEVMLIDKATGAILWQSPSGVFSLQHDATMLPDGNVLAFDNGLFRPGPPALLSAVREIDPRTNSVVWKYGGGRSQSDAVMFATSVMGGAERLPSGNTLITVSTAGRILEVTQSGAIAWEYQNMFRDKEGAARLVFKARKYDPAETKWGARVSSPLPFLRTLCTP